MFPSKWKILASPGVYLKRTSSSRAGIVGLIVLVALLLWAGTYWWAGHCLRAAQHSCEHFRYQEARNSINKCLAIWPNDYRANVLAARICRFLGDYVKAEKHLAACLKRQGKSGDIDLEWILLRATKDEFPELENQLRKWADECPSQSHLIWEGLAFCYVKEGRFLAAYDILDKWLSASPLATTFFLRGMMAQKLGGAKSALADFRQVLELDSEFWEARVQIVELLFGESDLDEGRLHLRILQQAQPHRPEVWLLLARDLFQKGELHDAENHLDKILQATPANYLALLERGKLALQKGQPAQAERWFRQALQAEPEMNVARYSLYLSLRQQPGREKEAQTELAKYHEDAQRFSRWQKILQEVERKPNDPEVLIEAGEFFVQSHQLSKARHYLLRALRARPGDEKGRKLLAIAVKE
jgi:tetratricopeptide (TPR) repeat protein